MKFLGVFFIALLLTGQATGQQPPEAYPGQREHAKPPDGFQCTIPQLAKDKAHACSCRRMVKNPEGDKCCETVERSEAPEDPKCTVYCHKDHCTCPIQCDTKGHVHGG